MLKQPTGGGNRLGPGRKYQRHLLSHVRQLSQPQQRQIWVSEALDAIVVSVAVGQLTLENSEGLLILVEGEQDWRCHHRGILPLLASNLGRRGHLGAAVSSGPWVPAPADVPPADPRRRAKPHMPGPRAVPFIAVSGTDLDAEIAVESL